MHSRSLFSSEIFELTRVPPLESVIRPFSPSPFVVLCFSRMERPAISLIKSLASLCLDPHTPLYTYQITVNK